MRTGANGGRSEKNVLEALPGLGRTIKARRYPRTRKMLIGAVALPASSWRETVHDGHRSRRRASDQYVERPGIYLSRARGR
jgi:hypothetical protein